MEQTYDYNPSEEQLVILKKIKGYYSEALAQPNSMLVDYSWATIIHGREGHGLDWFWGLQPMMVVMTVDCFNELTVSYSHLRAEILANELLAEPYTLRKSCRTHPITDLQEWYDNWQLDGEDIVYST